MCKLLVLFEKNEFLNPFMFFGPVQNEDGFWRITMNYELNGLIKNADIVRFVKRKRMA